MPNPGMSFAEGAGTADRIVRNRAPRACSSRLADDARNPYVHDLELRDYERFLDRWRDAGRSTLASSVSLVKAFSEYLFERGYTREHVAYRYGVRLGCGSKTSMW